MKKLLIVLFLAQLSAFSSPVAVIDGRVLGKKEFELVFELYWKEILHLIPKKPTLKDKELFLIEYIKGQIIEDVAQELGITVTENEIDNRLGFWGVKTSSNRIIRDFVRREILTEKVERVIAGGVYVTESEIRAYYILNKREFYYPKQVKLLRVVAEDKRLAERARKLLKKGEIPKGKGYRVGRERWYSLQALPKKVRKRLYPYKVGRVTLPIRFDGKYIILKIVDTREPGVLPISMVREKVRSKLIRQKKEEVLRKWFRDVLSNYQLEIYPENL